MSSGIMSQPFWFEERKKQKCFTQIATRGFFLRLLARAPFHLNESIEYEKRMFYIYNFLNLARVFSLRDRGAR